MRIEISIKKSVIVALGQVYQDHWFFCASTTPIAHICALDASKLLVPEITVFGARIDGGLIGAEY